MAGGEISQLKARDKPGGRRTSVRRTDRRGDAEFINGLLERDAQLSQENCIAAEPCRRPPAPRQILDPHLHVMSDVKSVEADSGFLVSRVRIGLVQPEFRETTYRFEHTRENEVAY